MVLRLMTQVLRHLAPAAVSEEVVVRAVGAIIAIAESQMVKMADGNTHDASRKVLALGMLSSLKCLCMCVYIHMNCMYE